MFCAVFVCNNAFLDKFIGTCSALIYTGKFTGDIVLVTSDDVDMDELLKDTFIKHHQPQITVKACQDIVFEDSAYKAMTETNAICGKTANKMFQFHKYHIFTPFFKQWKYVFYIDCGAKIFKPIQPILDCACENTLLAHSDAFPTYVRKLSGQFLEEKNKELCETWDLERDYFQSTIMLFDTSVIEENTFKTLCDLTERYPISRTNDQGILNLYFICIKDKWKQLTLGNENTHFYDFNIRNTDKPYIMTKYFIFND
jgi:hypothetical protein